jgi:3'-5' exoribonuclease
MDSKMNSITQIKEQDNNTGHWSGMIKHLDRIIYKNELPSFTSFVLPEKEKENEKDQKPTLGDKLKNFKLD